MTAEHARPPSLRELAQRTWEAFRNDPPGQRFGNLRRRMRQPGRGMLRAIGIGLGCLLLAGGIVMLIAPGPGLVAIAFGLALLASESQVLARLLDRAEPRLRSHYGALQRWWGRRGRVARAAMVAGVVCIVAAAVSAMGWLWLNR